MSALLILILIDFIFFSLLIILFFPIFLWLFVLFCLLVYCLKTVMWDNETKNNGYR